MSYLGYRWSVRSQTTNTKWTVLEFCSWKRLLCINTDELCLKTEIVSSARLVYYSTIENYKSDKHGFDGLAALMSLGNFLTVFFGAFALGCGMGCITALVLPYVLFYDIVFQQWWCVCVVLLIVGVSIFCESSEANLPHLCLLFPFLSPSFPFSPLADYGSEGAEPRVEPQPPTILEHIEYKSVLKMLMISAKSDMRLCHTWLTGEMWAQWYQTAVACRTSFDFISHKNLRWCIILPLGGTRLTCGTIVLMTLVK